METAPFRFPTIAEGKGAIDKKRVIKIIVFRFISLRSRGISI
jgi:hypothetical protein